MHQCIFEAEEHECKEVDDSFIEKISKNSEDFLGIQKYDPNLSIGCKCENECKKIQANYYIGYRWFEVNQSYIHIKPKLFNNKRADFLAMFLEILNDPIVSKKTDKIYKIFFNEPLIEVKTNEDYALEFLVIHFLKVVNEIIKKGLKKGYVKIEENLSSKIKGRILVNQTIKYNLAKNRFDRTFCNYQVYTINCLENQILKTALLQCSKVINIFKNENIIKIFRQNLSAFEVVDTKEVYTTDFFKIKHSPFYKEYKIALKLAKMIFKRLGFSIHSKENRNKIPPHFINMPELFERYVEIQLRRKYPDLIDGNRDNRTLVWRMRPDFLIPSKKYILDAKYKFWYESEEGSILKDDFSQLSLYGRIKVIKDILNVKCDDEIKLIFIYPTTYNKSKIFKYKEFCNIYRCPVKIPLVKV